MSRRRGPLTEAQLVAGVERWRRRLAAHPEGDDAAQEWALAALEAAPRARTPNVAAYQHARARGARTSALAAGPIGRPLDGHDPPAGGAGAEETAAGADDAEALAGELATLPTSELAAVVYRFGLDGGGERTFEEAGRLVGLSQEGCRKACARALGRLRGRLGCGG